MSVSPPRQTMSVGTAEMADIRSVDASVADPRRWLALPVLLDGAFLPILDFNVVNLAPIIRRDLLPHQATCSSSSLSQLPTRPRDEE